MFMKHRPIVIAERHNASLMTYIFYCYLKNNPTITLDYCLFEGALETKTHLANAQKSFDLYSILIADFLKTQDSYKIQSFLEDDLYYEHKEVTDFSAKKIDKKIYPHGFGQVRNLSTHFLLYALLKKQNTAWVAIDDKRHYFKEIVEQKIIDGTAYLYKNHKNIGQITTLKQKILLEAAPIRSKYMSDKIIDYANKGKVLVLIGSRHALDMAHYTPDLTDIIGFNPQNELDNHLYYYNIHSGSIRFDVIKDNADFAYYYRPVTQYNTAKIKSNFGLNSMYLSVINNSQNL